MGGGTFWGLGSLLTKAKVIVKYFDIDYQFEIYFQMRLLKLF